MSYSVYNTYLQNPYDPDTVNQTMSSMVEIGKVSHFGEGSKVSKFYIDKMRSLQRAWTSSVEVSEFASKLDTEYDLSSYVDIENDVGWSSTDIYDDEGKLLVKASSERSRTGQMIYDDITEIGKFQSKMTLKGKLPSGLNGRINARLKELKLAQGWVGYDGVIREQDLTHMRNGLSLNQVYNEWFKEHKNYTDLIKAEHLNISNIQEAMIAPNLDAPDDAKQQISESILKIEEYQKMVDRTAAQYGRVRYDYKNLGEPSKQDMIRMLGLEGGPRTGESDKDLKIMLQGLSGPEYNKWKAEIMDKHGLVMPKSVPGGTYVPKDDAPPPPPDPPEDPEDPPEDPPEDDDVSLSHDDNLLAQGFDYDPVGGRWYKDGKLATPAQIKAAQPVKPIDQSKANDSRLRRTVEATRKRLRLYGSNTKEDKAQRKAINDSIKNQEYNIPEELLKELPKEWQDYIMLWHQAGI